MIGTGTTIGLSLGLLLAIAQMEADVPEGFATMTTFKNQGVSRQLRLTLAALFAVPILMGATLGFWLVRERPELLQLSLLAFAAGLPAAVVLEEAVPEAHRDGEARFGGGPWRRWPRSPVQGLVDGRLQRLVARLAYPLAIDEEGRCPAHTKCGTVGLVAFGFLPMVRVLHGRREPVDVEAKFAGIFDEQLLLGLILLAPLRLAFEEEFEHLRILALLAGGLRRLDREERVPMQREVPDDEANLLGILIEQRLDYREGGTAILALGIEELHDGNRGAGRAKHRTVFAYEPFRFRCCLSGVGRPLIAITRPYGG